MKKPKKDGKTLLWVYAPNYVQNNMNSIMDMSDITGINIKSMDNSDSLVQVDYGKSSVLDEYKFSQKVKSLFYVDDVKATVWGKYFSNGKAALVYKQHKGFKSVYSAVGNLPANVLRKIAQFAGVHIYNYENDPIYVNNKIIGIYNNTNVINIKMKDDYEIEELFEGSFFRTENKCLNIPNSNGKAKSFFLSKKKQSQWN